MTYNTWNQKYQICTRCCDHASAIRTKNRRNTMNKTEGKKLVNSNSPSVGAKAAQTGCRGPASTALAMFVMYKQIGVKPTNRPATHAYPTTILIRFASGCFVFRSFQSMSEGSGGIDTFHSCLLALKRQPRAIAASVR